MKTMQIAAAVLCLTATAGLGAQALPPQSQPAAPQKTEPNFVEAPASSRPLAPNVVVAQGDIELTLTDIDGRISRIPPDARANFINDPERIETLLRNMLLTKQMAHEAEALGIDDDPVVAADLQYARDEVLAKRRAAVLLKEIKFPNFETMAKERYIASPELFHSPEMISVRHILLARDKYGDAGAKKKAEEIHAEILAKGGDFQDYVEKYTDEELPKQGSDAKDEVGFIQDIARGDTSNDFEEAAFALKKVGDMSGVVPTRFGYHIIKLEKLTPSERIPFEKIKPKVIDDLRQEFLARQRQDFLDKTRSIAIDANPDVIRSLRTRYLPGNEGAVAVSKFDSGVAVSDFEAQGKDAAGTDAKR